MSRLLRCDDKLIERLLNGELVEAESAVLEEHLAECLPCQRRLTALSARQKFWDDTRSFLQTVDCVGELDPSLDFLSWDDMEADEATLSTIRDIPLLPTDDPDKLGRFGGYEITGVIGRGGMGVVLKGWDRTLDRFVAIKVLNPTYAHQSAARLRFAREAKAAAAIVHDNIVAIFGVDSCNGLPYLVMPYVKGESLQRRIERQSPLSIEAILEISLQIARGLQAAHDQGVIHRDIKPANILLPESVSRVVITDFGLARAVDDAALTRSGVIAGTPSYMSPEQASGGPIDTRSDLFSLGSVMYAMTCGHPPFHAETAYGMMRRIIDEPHQRLSHSRPDIPVWLQQLVDHLLEKNPAKRIATAAELAGYLERCLAYIRQPQNQSAPKPIHTPYRKFPSRLALVGCVLFAVLTAGAIAGWLHLPTHVSTPPSVEAILPDAPAQDLDRDLNQLETNLYQLEQELDE